MYGERTAVVAEKLLAELLSEILPAVSPDVLVELPVETVVRTVPTWKPVPVPSVDPRNAVLLPSPKGADGNWIVIAVVNGAT